MPTGRGIGSFTAQGAGKAGPPQTSTNLRGLQGGIRVYTHTSAGHKTAPFNRLRRYTVALGPAEAALTPGRLPKKRLHLGPLPFRKQSWISTHSHPHDMASESNDHMSEFDLMRVRSSCFCCFPILTEFRIGHFQLPINAVEIENGLAQRYTDLGECFD